MTQTMRPTPLIDTPLPAPPPARHDCHPVPDEQYCFALWETYAMLENIRKHSLCVAKLAVGIARLGKQCGFPVNTDLIYTAALLHDIAKTYTIRHGGNHSQLGGAWVQELTGNPLLASCVTHHVYWPFELNLEKHFPQLAVLYADKRVQHDCVVSLEERFEDLLERYGATQRIRDNIHITMEQARNVEKAFSQSFKVNIDEYTLDCGWME